MFVARKSDRKFRFIEGARRGTARSCRRRGNSTTIIKWLRNLRDAENEHAGDYPSTEMDSLLNECLPNYDVVFTGDVLKRKIRAKLRSLLRPPLQTFHYRYANTPEGDHHLEEANLMKEVENSRLPGGYVLLWAAFNGNIELLHKLLLSKVADINFTYPGENLNALHLSALNDSPECIEWLLNAAGAFHTMMDSSDDLQSVLNFALIGNSLANCRYLVECGVPVDSAALHVAVRANSLDCVEYLLLDPKIPINEYDESCGMTPLHVAADAGNVRILQLLLSDGRVDVNAKTTSRKYTALHLAAESGYYVCTKMILERGARVDELSAKGQTPLYLACKETFSDCVEALLGYQATVNVQDGEKRTPLHAAVSNTLNHSQIHIVRRLVERQADVHLADDFGYTALHVAAVNELEECVEYLIMNGANVAAKTKGNVTALNIINRKTPISSSKVNDRLDLSLAYNHEHCLKFSFRDIIRNSTVGEVDYLYTLQKEGQADVLEHPLCEAFLHLKWQKVRIFILLRVGTSLVIVALLTLMILFGLSVPTCKNEQKNCTEVGRESQNESFTYSEVGRESQNESFTYSEVGRESQNESFTYSEVRWYLTPVILFMLIFVNIVRVVFTFPGYESAKYFFTSYSNIFEIFVTVCQLLMALMNINNELVNSTGDFKKVFAAPTILCSWMHLMIVVSQLPTVGTYTAMFKKVLKEFVKMIFAFLCLLLGFTFTFCVLRVCHFDNPFAGFVKIIAMMTGDLNYNDLKTSNNDDEKKLWLIFVLAIFIIMIPIVLMNLLIGIAVNDVEGLRKNAGLCELIQQTKLIHFLEKTWFKGFLPKCVTDPLRQFLFIWPDSYTNVLYVRPLSPYENRLPRKVMEAGLKIALNRLTKKMADKTHTDMEMSLEGRMYMLRKHVLKLQERFSLFAKQ